MPRWELDPGEWRTVDLEGMGSAGYVWTFAIEGLPSVVTVTKELSRRDTTHAPRESFDVVERFAVLAQSPGRVTLTFAQVRPWEAECVSPRAQVQYEVLVRDAG